MSKPFARRGWALALVLVVCAAGASAADRSEFAQKVAEGELSAAAKLLAEESVAADLRSDVATLAASARSLADRAGKGANAADVTSIGTFLVAASEAAAAAKPDDARAWLALAESRAALLASVASSGKKAPGDAWIAALEAYEKACSLATPGDDERRLCLRRVLEGAGSATSQGAVLVARPLALAAKALKDPATSPTTRLAYVGTLHEAAKVLVATDRKAARDVVKSATDLLRPLHDGRKTGPGAAALWNSLVTLDRGAKLGLGEKYVTAAVAVFDGNYTLELPVGKRWRAVDGSSPSEQEDWGEHRPAGQVHRFDDEGDRTGWMWSQMFSFAWVHRYADTKNPVGGDNPGAIAEMSQSRFASFYFRQVASKKAPRRGKLNDHVTGFAYELAGTSNGGRPLRIRAWVFRGRGQRSYGLNFMDEAPSDVPDPELEAVLDSLREVED